MFTFTKNNFLSFLRPRPWIVVKITPTSRGMWELKKSTCVIHFFKKVKIYVVYAYVLVQ